MGGNKLGRAGRGMQCDCTVVGDPVCCCSYRIKKVMLGVLSLQC